MESVREKNAKTDRSEEKVGESGKVCLDLCYLTAAVGVICPPPNASSHSTLISLQLQSFAQH